MGELSRERCQPGAPAIAPQGAAELLASLSSSWRSEGGRLQREYRLRGFGEPVALAVRIALLAEREDHHPELHLGYGHLEVELTTHSAGGLTRNDFIVAAKIDELT
jgi:4a-hydroxytetrahydrobiopterin dehydratase